MPGIGNTAFPPRRRENGRLRVGIVGAGDISLNHLTAWAKAGRTKVVAICDRSRERAEARAHAFGVPAVYEDARAMLAAEKLDILDVATWRDTHVELVRLGADFGVDILCQKPLAPTLAEAEALVAAVGTRVRLMVNENRRFAERFRAIGARIAAGRLGELRQCNMIMHRSGLLPDAQGVRPAIARSAGMGHEKRLLVVETFIHQIDVLRFLIGRLHVVAARMLRSEPDLPGETLATILFETNSHAPVLLAGSMVASGFGTAVSDRLELIGSRASMVLDGDELTVRDGGVEQIRFDLKTDYQTCFDAAIRHFTDCLWDGTTFESDAEDNLETLRLVDRAYEAAQTGIELQG